MAALGRVDIVDRSDLGQEDSLCSGLKGAPNKLIICK